MDQQPNPSPQQESGPARPRRRRFGVWIVLLILVVAGLLLLRHERAQKAAAKKPSGPPALPVVVAKTVRGDIGVYFTGLGAVAPLNTVTVKTRIDGQLMKVIYREGDLVHEGDVLVE